MQILQNIKSDPTITDAFVAAFDTPAELNTWSTANPLARIVARVISTKAKPHQEFALVYVYGSELDKAQAEAAAMREQLNARNEYQRVFRQSLRTPEARAKHAKAQARYRASVPLKTVESLHKVAEMAEQARTQSPINVEDDPI
jgi:hypothetical protein